MEENTLAMEVLADFKQSNKRFFITIIMLILLQLFTVSIFVWYINQFDYYTETTTMDGNGTNNYIGNDGDINNGDKSIEEN